MRGLKTTLVAAYYLARLAEFDYVGLMSVSVRRSLLLALTGMVFLLAGFRDRYWPGHWTFNHAPPSRAEIGIAMAFGLLFLGAAAFRLIRSEPPH